MSNVEPWKAEEKCEMKTPGHVVLVRVEGRFQPGRLRKGSGTQVGKHVHTCDRANLGTFECDDKAHSQRPYSLTSANGPPFTFHSEGLPVSWRDCRGHCLALRSLGPPAPTELFPVLGRAYLPLVYMNQNL